MGIEIERKFLVPSLPEGLPESLNIRQGYMLNQKERIVRVRIKGDQGFLTVKGKTTGLARHEFEYRIPVDDAGQMLELFCEKPLIEKRRYRVTVKGCEWVIDEFLGKNKGLQVAEIELSRPDQPFDLPAWAGREVSGDPRYFNSNLIRHPFSAW